MGINPTSFAAFSSNCLLMVNIVLLVDDIHILIDVVIFDPIWIDLVSQTSFSHGVVVT